MVDSYMIGSIENQFREDRLVLFVISLIVDYFFRNFIKNRIQFSIDNFFCICMFFVKSCKIVV